MDTSTKKQSSAPPSVRQRQRARNLRALQTERRARCLWSAGPCGDPVRLFVKDGEDTPFGVCAVCQADVLARHGYRPFDGPGPAA